MHHSPSSFVKSGSQRLVEGCDWSAAPRAEWVDWDDGHVPENLQHDENCATTKLVQDPYYHASSNDDDESQPTAMIHVVDDSVHDSLVQALYDKTIQATQPWGAYVTVEQVQHEWSRHSTPYDPHRHSAVESDLTEDQLSVQIVAAYLHHLLTAPGRSTTTLDELVRDAHGVAIWALGSNEGSQVPYHLDYAEQLRYEHNIVVPPIWAGTFQCTPAAVVVEGGSFCVHTAGLSHYERHGYKGLKSGKTDWHAMMHDNGEEEVLEYTPATAQSTVLDKDHRNCWIDITFRCNRMIIMSGHLPHLSTPVKSVVSPSFPEAVGATQLRRRVIVGFNVFQHNIGPFVQRAPEHSPAFRRRVAMQRLLMKQQKQKQQQGGGPCSSSGENDLKKTLSIEAVRANPMLAKLLVLGKRQKVKDELLMAQSRLDEAIDSILLQSQQQQQSQPHDDDEEEQKTRQTAATTTVQSLMEQLGHDDGTWPNAIDVHVHIHHRCQQGRWKAIRPPQHADQPKQDKLIPLDTLIESPGVSPLSG